MNDAPQITRVRHEIKRRRLTVERVEHLAPKMVRVVLKGEELQGFTSLGFDDHVKLFFPGSGGQPAEPVMRDYTPRLYDAGAGELWIDFYLHDAGPATSWAAQVVPGQTLEVGGPKGSSVISVEGIDFHVLAGDETALPAIARRLEELPPDTRALVVLAEEGEQDYPLESRAKFEVVRVSPGDTDGRAQRIIDALRALSFPRESCFVWLATESHVARAIRRYFIDERGFDKGWIKAAGYWRTGAAAAHENIMDER
ncbi:MAG: siderophore-interacting protein [Pseudomonadota bacterium]